MIGATAAAAAAADALILNTLSRRRAALGVTGSATAALTGAVDTLSSIRTIGVVFTAPLRKTAGIVQAARARRLSRTVVIRFTIDAATDGAAFRNVAAARAAAVVTAGPVGKRCTLAITAIAIMSIGTVSLAFAGAIGFGALVACIRAWRRASIRWGGSGVRRGRAAVKTWAHITSRAGV
jgi:hypothetical protein